MKTSALKLNTDMFMFTTETDNTHYAYNNICDIVFKMFRDNNGWFIIKRNQKFYFDYEHDCLGVLKIFDKVVN